MGAAAGDTCRICGREHCRPGLSCNDSRLVAAIAVAVAAELIPDRGPSSMSLLIPTIADKVREARP